MKKIILFLFALLLINACSPKSDRISLIEGSIDRGGVNTISLFEVKNGSLHIVSTYRIAEDNKFYFAFSPETENFYSLGVNSTNPQDTYTFYFKPGDKLNVAINDSTYVLTGENTPENKEMERWHDLIFPMEYKSVYFTKSFSDFTDFFPLLEEKKKEADNYEIKHSKNSVFNEKFAEYRQIDFAHLAFFFLVTPRHVHPETTDFSEFFKTVNVGEITTLKEIENYPFANFLLRNYAMNYPKINPDGLSNEDLVPYRSSIGALDLILAKTKNDVLKGQAVVSQASAIKTYDNFVEYNEKYGKYLISEDQQKAMNAYLKSVTDNAPGKEASNFTFEDINGKKISLSDFRGKIVYIDVWATWCGPCIKEIPNLKKLADEYKRKEIVFLGISVDSTKDKQKWKSFIEKESLKGIQIFAGDDAKDIIMGPYGISGIPRFILIDKEGKIISGDAPRPSSSEIKPLLDASLAK